MKNKTDEYIYTSDFSLASYLVYKKYFLEAIETSRNGKYTFIFKKVQRNDDVENLFYAGKLLINPIDYESARKTLKSRLFSTVR